MDLKTLKSDLNNWTLASDQKLLDLLQNFSREIDEKASKCCNDVDSLSHDVAETEVCMRNIFNEFLMLGSTQFIENRVYDDDDDVEDEGLEESKTDASSVADPLILMKDAFSFGQEALRLYYYDDVHTNKVEDIYNIRALPYIIGTQLFNESPDAGLGFAVFPEEVEETPTAQTNEDNIQENRTLSISENEIPRTYPVNEKPEIAEESWDEPDTPPPPPPVQSAPLSLAQIIAAQVNRQGNNGDLSAASSREDTSIQEEGELPPVIRPNFPILPKHHSSDHDEKSPSEIVDSLPNKGIPLDNKTEDDAEDDDLFASQEDPYSLFSNKKLVASKKIPGNDLLSDLFGKTDSDMTKARSLSTSRSSFSGLFGELNEDSLFDDIPTLSGGAKPNSSTKDPPSDSRKDLGVLANKDQQKAENLFGASLFDLPSQTQKSEKRTNRFAELFGNDDDVDGLFSQVKTAGLNSSKEGSNNLENKIFEEPPQTGTDPIKTNGSKFPEAGITRLPVNTYSAIAAIPRPQRADSSDNDFSDDDAKMSAPKTIAAVLNQTKNAAEEKGSSSILGSVKSSSLFDADEPLVTSKPSASKSSSLFDSDEPLVTSKPSASKSSSLFDADEPLVTSKPSASKSSSLFDADEPLVTSKPSASKSSSLFDADEPLVTSKPSASKSSSLFDADEPLVTSKPSASKSSSLFGVGDPIPPPATEPSVSSVTSGDSSSARSEKISQLAAGIKLVLPGMPMKFSSNTEPGLIQTENEEKSFESVTNVKLGRAVMTAKSRRTPSKKLFDFDDTESAVRSEPTKSGTSKSSSLFESEPVKTDKPGSTQAVPKSSLFDEEEPLTSSVQTSKSGAIKSTSLFESESVKSQTVTIFLSSSLGSCSTHQRLLPRTQNDRCGALQPVENISIRLVIRDYTISQRQWWCQPYTSNWGRTLDNVELDSVSLYKEGTRFR